VVSFLQVSPPKSCSIHLLPSPVRATRTVNQFLLDLIILLIFGCEYKSWNSSCSYFLPVWLKHLSQHHSLENLQLMFFPYHEPLLRLFHTIHEILSPYVTGCNTFLWQGFFRLSPNFQVWGPFLVGLFSSYSINLQLMFMPRGCLFYLKIKDTSFHADRDQLNIDTNTHIYTKYYAVLW